MGLIRATGQVLALAACAVAVSACGGSSSSALPAGPAKGVIDHVVIIVQENRSFDNLFQGAPGADTQSYGYDHYGNKITLEPVGLATTWDLEHSFQAFVATCNGGGNYGTTAIFPGLNCRMNGFDREGVGCGGSGEPGCPIKHPQYAYVPHREIKPYFDMASQYVLADHMFVSNLDISSFVSHQYIIAAQAGTSVNIPEGGPWGCGGGPNDLIATLSQQRVIGPLIPPCFDYKTLADELDAAQLPWKYYTSALNADGNFWNAFQAVKHIRYGRDWKKDVIDPQTRFFDDIKKNGLGAVTWITPTCENSDHAGCDSDTGPKWVATLVNAIGESPYWKSTAIFIFWDDPGGWYDHVPPKELDYDGLGYRVPLLIVSPYAKRGYVSHVDYEHGSLLRFIEDRFGLATLSASDARATSPEADCFDFLQAPRKFVPIQTTMTERDFEREPLDRRIPDKE